MLRRLLASAAALFLGAAPPQASVVRIQSNPGCLESFSGSGVVVAPGLVVTNAHVVHGSQNLEVQKDGMSYRVQAHILAPEYDLCLLRVPALGAPPAELAEDVPQVGQALEAWGYPGGVRDLPNLVPSILAATWKYRRNVLLQLQATIVGGHSGGGLFTAEGRLVGITTFNLLGTGQTHFAVPVTWIHDLLELPWAQGDRVPLCKPRSVLLHELLDRLTEDPENRPPWEAFTRAWVTAQPKQAEAWYALGHVLLVRYIDLGRQVEPDPALRQTFVDAFRKAVALDPSHARAWNNLGVALHESGDPKGAREALEMALRLKPDYGLAWLNLSAPLVDQLRFAEAVVVLRKGLTLVPDSADSWARLGFCELRLDHLAEAEAALRIALRYRPFHRPWLIELAEILHRRRDTPGLEAIKERLAERDPEGLEELQRALISWKARTRPVR